MISVLEKNLSSNNRSEVSLKKQHPLGAADFERGFTTACLRWQEFEALHDSEASFQS